MEVNIKLNPRKDIMTIISARSPLNKASPKAGRLQSSKINTKAPAVPTCDRIEKAFCGRHTFLKKTKVFWFLSKDKTTIDMSIPIRLAGIGL